MRAAGNLDSAALEGEAPAFFFALALAQRCGSGPGGAAGVLCAAAGCPLISVRTAKAERCLPICECGVARRLAAVIFVPSLSSLIRIRGVRAQETGRQHGRWSAGRSTPIEATTILNLDQSGLFWLLSPRLATGYVIGLPLWGHIKSLLRNQDRERGGVWGVGFCVVAAQDFCDAARRLEGCFSASESAA